MFYLFNITFIFKLFIKKDFQQKWIQIRTACICEINGRHVCIMWCQLGPHRKRTNVFPTQQHLDQTSGWAIMMSNDLMLIINLWDFRDIL